MYLQWSQCSKIEETKNEDKVNTEPQIGKTLGMNIKDQCKIQELTNSTPCTQRGWWEIWLLEGKKERK